MLSDSSPTSSMQYLTHRFNAFKVVWIRTKAREVVPFRNHGCSRQTDRQQRGTDGGTAGTAGKARG